MSTELPYQRLKRLRTEHHLSQNQVSDKIGCTTKTYRSWEKENKFGHLISANADELSALADLFHVSVDYLLCRTDDLNIGNSEISAAIGLSESSIELLRHIKRTMSISTEPDDRFTLKFLNTELQDAAAHYNRPTVFGDMYRYMVSSRARMLVPSATCNSKDFYRSGRIFSQAAIDLDGDTMLINTDGLYRQYLMNCIRKHLDDLQERFIQEYAETH